ncbi:PREDICTED: protein unc-80 homolog [Acropora digitifera]|uniref:protein unc-80 homolog n=1 Tax=Acropora digitifera TaxID=70779 RepID=UPI00077B0F72|nr:PREDICTED: protein unc-80 homolog [Acropora digitifera]
MRALPISMEATVGVNVIEDDKEHSARWDVWHYHLVTTETTEDVNEEDTGESQQVDAELWPQAVSSAIPCIIEMMDDVMVASDKRAVMEVARRLVWQFLVDDSVLFFRTILEQFTKKDKQEEQVSLLRKLLLYITELPPTSSRFLINNLIGVAMYYARTNKPGSQDSLALVLSLLWQAVPSVRGFLFKDLKQSLRKEHCDNALRISSNVPGAKKLCVVLPDQDKNEDQEKTKETVPVHDEMTFGKVLEEFKSRLLNGNEEKELYLIDKKSDQILEDRYHVRDVYTHRKGFPSPLLLLEFLDEESAFNKRQSQAFTAKIAEIGRVLLTSSMLNALPNQKHISFLHEEFSRQISFPRKALDCDFSLYAGGPKGKELAALDVIHKSVWVKVSSCSSLHRLGKLKPQSREIRDPFFRKYPKGSKAASKC